MPTQLPTDANNNAIPALRLRSGGAHAVNTSAASAKNAAAFNAETKIVSLYATADVYVKFSASAGDSATSSDHFFPAGVYYDFAKGGNSYVHALRASADGKLYISEKE